LERKSKHFDVVHAMLKLCHVSRISNAKIVQL